MDSRPANAEPDNAFGEHSAEGQDVLRAGEKGFTIVLLAAAAFFLYQSILLWIAKPGVDGPTIIPLISSGAVTVLALRAAVLNIRKRTAADSTTQLRARLVTAYLLPADVVVAIAAIIIYCVLLGLGVSFYILTPVFLWGLMTFFAKGGYIKNLIWTAICMAFILLVFRLLFGVMLP